MKENDAGMQPVTVSLEFASNNYCDQFKQYIAKYNNYSAELKSQENSKLTYIVPLKMLNKFVRQRSCIDKRGVVSTTSTFPLTKPLTWSL